MRSTDLLRIFILFSTLVCLIQSVQAEQTEISFDDNIIMLDPFEKANVNIVLKNGSQIHTLSISLEYNRDIARVQNVTSPFKIESIELKGNTLNITVLTAGKLSDDFTPIANLTIKALSEGFTVMSISRAEGYDVNGNPVNVSIPPGTGVEIIVGENVPEGFEVLGIFLRFIGLAALCFVAILAIVLIAIGFVIFLILKAKKKSYRGLLYYYLAVAIFIALCLYLMSEFLWW